jgi:hypothetical protein
MHFSFPHISFSRGRSKLNLLLFEEDWPAAIAEIECHPHETKVWTTRPGFFDGDHESNVLPIHVACSVHAPLEVIKAIVEAYPECVQAIESAFKRLPLHVACQFAARAGVIKYLVEQYMAGTMESDILGRLPIHYACSNGAPLDVVKVLLSVNTASTLYSDLNGWVPLHVAVHFGAETAVVKEILDASPPSIVNLKTRKGNTPMSLAKKITWKNKDEVLALLDHAHQCSGMETDLIGVQKVRSSFVSYAA